VNGTFNITDEDGNEVLLADTRDDMCYVLAKSDYGKTISFRWDGLLMSAEFDGSNARFWRNVKKLVNSEERLVLLNEGRFVSPDRALSKLTYQLARIKDMKILKEVCFQRGEDVIDVDLNEEKALAAIERTWGVANWRIVDGFGTPFPVNDLRDGTKYFPLKDGEVLQNRQVTRSFSTFTVNKVSDEVRFIVKCRNQTQHIWMKPFTWIKLIEVCKSIWGPGFYKWNDKDTKELHGRVLQVQKLPMKESASKIVHFKISYEDEPGKPMLMEVQSKCGIHEFELAKVLKCRLWGRDFYLDTRQDKNTKFDWEGKTFQVIWRIRGGMYKEDSRLESPNPLEELPPDRKFPISIVCDME
jgi:hypothetical protein